MRIHIQRVAKASVKVEEKAVGEIGPGLLLLVAAHKDDSADGLERMADKCLNLRIFSDESGKMNKSVRDIGGGLLVISNFTLYGDCKKGNRPNFMGAAPGPVAERLYDQFVGLLKTSELDVQTGVFGAMMDVELVNDGPVTLLLES